MKADAFDFDPVALKRKYDEERDKRRALRPEGVAQFRSMMGELEHYAEDPYTPVEERAPRQVETDVVIVGGGFAGMLAAARLTKEGIDDFLVLERGGDFGGTWYWNRYPGAACDVESHIYLPLLEEVGTVPLFATAKLLLKFRPEGKEWWEYLDQIWDAEEAAERASLSVLPALMLRAHKEHPS